eukprot:8782338-Alexandrium_andersonii.AAC.1
MFPTGQACQWANGPCGSGMGHGMGLGHRGPGPNNPVGAGLVCRSSSRAVLGCPRLRPVYPVCARLHCLGGV